MGVIENKIDITELQKRGGGGGGGTAASVSYDNTSSHMTATDVQAALDELNLDIAEGLALVNTSVAANREAILGLEEDFSNIENKYVANGTSTFTFTASGEHTIAEDLASAWAQFLTAIQNGDHDYYTIREFAVDGVNHNNPNVSQLTKSTANVNLYFDYADLESNKYTFRKCKCNTSNSTFTYLKAEITSSGLTVTDMSSTTNTKNIILRCYAYDKIV